MTTETSVVPAVITVLLADSKPMESQLLAGSLRHRGFEVFSCDGEVSSILEFVESGSVKVAVISCTAAHSGLSDMTALRTLHLTHPQIPKVCLMETRAVSWRCRPSARARAVFFLWLIRRFNCFANALSECTGARSLPRPSS